MSYDRMLKAFDRIINQLLKKNYSWLKKVHNMKVELCCRGYTFENQLQEGIVSIEFKIRRLTRMIVKNTRLGQYQIEEVVIMIPINVE